MNILRTLIQLTTTATLAACLQLNMGSAAFAARVASNSTGNSIEARSLTESSQTSRLGTYAKYEPDPNGNPKSDGTGTR